MDATALYAYKYHNVYILYHCSRDGYPNRLGASLVRGIPTEQGEFNDWLMKLREYYGHIVERISECDATDGFGHCRGPSCSPPMNGVYVRWVYTIDLDKMIFSVDNGAHFRLDRIPRGEDGEEWIRFLGQDGTGWRCLRPSTPRSMIAELYPEVDASAVARDAYQYYSLGATLVDPLYLLRDCSATDVASQELMITVVKALIGHFYGKLCVACKYEPTDARFQRPAEYLLKASAPNFLQLQLASERASDYPSRELSRNRNSVSQGSREPGLFFWFRGRLILLSTQLDSETHLRANVTRVVSHIKAKMPHLRSCTALIWSMRHVVVVRVVHGRIVHTAAQPVLVAYGMPVLAAYGVDDGAFSTSVRLLAHFLRPVRIGLESGAAEGYVFPCSSSQPSETAGNDNEPCPAGEDDGCETTSRSLLGNINTSLLSLPTDIILEIMKFTDLGTYNAVFSRLTRATRAVWASHPRVGPYSIFGLRSASGCRFTNAPDRRAISSWSTRRGEVADDGKVNNAYTFSNYNLSSGLASPMPGRSSLLAHTETGCPVHLDVVYEGHPYLGNRPLSAIYNSCKYTCTYGFSCPMSARNSPVRVDVRWPSWIESTEGRSWDESVDDLQTGRGSSEEWFTDVERCGLVLSIL